MFRAFDGFEIDDFRGSDSGLDRDVSRSPSSDWSKWTDLRNIHREEERADGLDREGRDRSDRDRPPLAREERVQTILSQRVRTSTRTATRPMPCGIPRFTRCRRLESSVLSPLGTWPNSPTTVI